MSCRDAFLTFTGSHIPDIHRIFHPLQTKCREFWFCDLPISREANAYDSVVAMLQSWLVGSTWLDGEILSRSTVLHVILLPCQNQTSLSLISLIHQIKQIQYDSIDCHDIAKIRFSMCLNYIRLDRLICLICTCS